MSKTRVLSLIAIAILATSSMAAFAQRGGGGMGGGAAGARGDFGGRSDSHISGSGLRNSNGPDAIDRDRGHARAADRSEMRARAPSGKAHSHRKS